LSELGKHYCLFKENEFTKTRETLESKHKQLRQEGKGHRPNKPLGLNDDELEKPWLANQLGDHSPEALILTVWLNNTMHFGWRAKDGKRKVLIGDLELQREGADNISSGILKGAPRQDAVRKSSVPKGTSILRSTPLALKNVQLSSSRVISPGSHLK